MLTITRDYSSILLFIHHFAHERKYSLAFLTYFLLEILRSAMVLGFNEGVREDSLEETCLIVYVDKVAVGTLLWLVDHRLKL